METFYLTDSGVVRKHNEDSVIIAKNIGGEYLMLVADGMGGHRAGEVASSMVVSHFADAWHHAKTIGTLDEAKRWVKDEIDEVNNRINDYARHNTECKGMGTTVVLAVVTESFVLVANVGDSRCYSYEQTLQLVTVDHTLVNALYLQGEITEEEAQNHPKRNVLMRALGTNKSIEVDFFVLEPTQQILMLCSDGLTNALASYEIAQVLSSDFSLAEKGTHLILQANGNGAQDNVSVALLRVGGMRHAN